MKAEKEAIGVFRTTIGNPFRGNIPVLTPFLEAVVSESTSIA
jgi:hypothetical protein